ncbi:S8 family serine peptidase [Deinococcus sp.]|uniref:S8 family serine peptidase n=1 Tax=Deinococcus sp. TaxID=47478 RepID=UPI0025C046B5|nr:S8 family serine peptidase [Deinococcus sp.]
MPRHPASVLLGLLTLALLSGCNPTPVTDPPAPAPAPVVPAPVVPAPVTPAPTTLDDRTVQLAQSASVSLDVPFSGTWSAVSVPAWLRLSRQAGTGNVALTVTADRSLATPLAADQQTLSAPVTLAWNSGTDSAARSGTVTWTVTATQYSLTGRVTAPAQVQGNDTGVAAPPTRTDTASLAGANGVIVRYRAATGTLSAQTQAQQTQAQQVQAQWQTVTGQAVRSLTSAGITGQAIRPLSSRSVAVQVDDVPAALAALRADPSVESVTPDVILRAQATAAPVTPTDQYAPLQWAFPLTGYGAVWRDMEGSAYSRAVTVAVIDTGVRFDHPDLKGQLWRPGEGALDLITETSNGDGDGPDTDPTDPAVTGRSTGSHGTHVAGIIAARWGLNDASCAACSLTGVVGATRNANVKVLPLRVIDATGNATESDVAVAIRYAAGLAVSVNGVMTRTPHVAQVINLSLGGATSADSAAEMCRAVQEATAAGSLVIAAAGNGYGTLPYYPAACPGAVAVASVTLSGGSAPTRSAFSNTYPQVQLAAPGGADPYTQGTFNGGTLNGQAFPDMILSTSWDYQKNEPNYELEVGTSQASPQVAALAALLLSKGVTTDAAGTLARMNATATDLGAAGRDDQFGYGLINAAAALNAPAVSSGHGLSLQDARGQTFQPRLDALGHFQAWLGDGTYRAVAGEDLNGNGIYGENGERRDERTFTLSDTQPSVDLGDLQAR